MEFRPKPLDRSTGPSGVKDRSSPSSFLSMVSVSQKLPSNEQPVCVLPLCNLLAFPQILGYGSSTCACQLDRTQKLQQQPLFTDSLENKDLFAVFLSSLKP